MEQAQNINSLFSDITEYFFPKVVGEVNDVYIKVAKIKGEKIPWHNHENEDELFHIIEGALLFEEEGKNPFIMREGDIYIVKKGVNHRVSSEEECRILLIENKTTEHTGKVETDITRTINDQLKN